MLNRIKSKTEGFTIIEVLIVLAIAGLIMLVVFLAVPALQRNARNNQRNSDASRIAAAVTECLSNRNNVIGSCDTDGDIEQGTMSQLIAPMNVALGSATTAPASSTTAAGIWYGRACTDDGSAAAPLTGVGAKLPASATSFVVLYSLEPAVTQCVSS